MGKIAEILRSWGLAPTPAPRRAAGRQIDVYFDAGEEKVRVGSLSEEDGAYVFRYHPSFAARQDLKAISAFPDKGEVYRSPNLFSFFQVRIPPPDRQDVQRVLRERNLDARDTLRLLAEIGGRSPTSPYVFEWRDDSKSNRRPPLDGMEPVHN